MLDPNFMHAVVLLGHHDGEGAQGLVINRLHPGGTTLAGLAIHEGGPVGLGQHQLLHGSAELAHCSTQVAEGLWMAREPGPVLKALEAGSVNPDAVRLFEGYSGWGSGQLETELAESAWLVDQSNADLVLGCSVGPKAWRAALRGLGPDVAGLAHLPPDVSWN